MNQVSRGTALWIVLLLMLALFYNVVERSDQKADEISYSEFREALEQGKIKEVTLNDYQVTGEIIDPNAPPTATSGEAKPGDPAVPGEKGRKFSANVPPMDDDLVKDLRNAKVKFTVKPKDEGSWAFALLVNWVPMLFIIGLWIFFMRQIQVGGGKALSFGKSRARLMEEGPSRVTFNDVAGVDESKSELEAVVQFLKDPKKFTKLGGRIPKGVLLVGSPGTGKTLLARAIAGEAGVPFFSISGSDFVEMFVGVGASRVRDLFVRGKKNAPCIIFIDEIDAVGRHRGAGLGGGHDEREQTLNQLLVEMDGFEMNEGVILIAATNRPDVLDPALLRPGRFDRTVVVPLPDVRGREAILKVHTKKIPLAPEISLEKIARGTPGFSGADLSNLVNEAALYAALKESEVVTLHHFEYAKDKILMGVERRSLIISEKEKKVTAYHEAGHALVAKLLPNADPVHKVTIIPRGVALGVTQQLPQADRLNATKDDLLSKICIYFGGRAAEELAFSEITVGAQSDISSATSIARRMVCEWGMSEKLGPLAYGKRDDAPFLGRDVNHQRDYAESTASTIDEEVRKIVETQLDLARSLLKSNQDILDALAEALLKEETLDGDQVDSIIARLRPGSGPATTSGGGSELKAA